MMMRYSDREGRVRFDDFVSCYIKLKSVMSECLSLPSVFLSKLMLMAVFMSVVSDKWSSLKEDISTFQKCWQKNKHSKIQIQHLALKGAVSPFSFLFFTVFWQQQILDIVIGCEWVFIRTVVITVLTFRVIAYDQVTMYLKCLFLISVFKYQLCVMNGWGKMHYFARLIKGTFVMWQYFYINCRNIQSKRLQKSRKCGICKRWSMF